MGTGEQLVRVHDVRRRRRGGRALPEGLRVHALEVAIEGSDGDAVVKRLHTTGGMLQTDPKLNLVLNPTVRMNPNSTE